MIDLIDGKTSFIQRLSEAVVATRTATKEDPWLRELASIVGMVRLDGVEYISVVHAFDFLEIPVDQRKRHTRRLAKVMRTLGWQSTRMRTINSYGFSTRLRGFAKLREI